MPTTTGSTASRWLGRYQQELETLHEALAEADADKLEQVFSEARKVRSNWRAE
jgi:prephenate dehydrogenase